MQHAITPERKRRKDCLAWTAEKSVGTGGRRAETMTDVIQEADDGRGLGESCFWTLQTGMRSCTPPASASCN